MDLTLTDKILSQAEATHRLVIEIVAEEIERDLELYLSLVALPDRADATGGFYPGDLAALIRRVNSRFRVAQLSGLFESVARAVDKLSFDKLSRVPGIDASRIIPGGAGALQRFREHNARLIETVPLQIAEDVGRALAERDVRTLHVRQAKDVLAERFGVAESRAEFWARDQTLKLYANVNEERHAAAGVTRYEWGHSEDERVRGRPDGLWRNSQGDHWVLKGKIFSWSEPPIVNPRTGERKHPGQDYQCRCTAYPVFD